MYVRKCMMSVVVILVTAVILTTSRVSADPTAALPIDGVTWAQPASVKNISYTELDAIFDTGTGLLDTSSATAGGHDFTGWAWASVSDIQTLLDSEPHEPVSVTIGGTKEEVNSDWAPHFLTHFTTTSSLQVWGVTRTVKGNGFVYEGKVTDVLAIDEKDEASLFPAILQGQAFRSMGVWLYANEASQAVPEPSLGLLLGISLIGLVGVGAIRKLKQKKAVANT